MIAPSGSTRPLREKTLDCLQSRGNVGSATKQLGAIGFMQVSWEQITALASVIGVFGGLISVGFLIYEVRRNAQAIEGATVQSLMTLEAQVFSVLAEQAELYVRGSAEAAQLTAVDRFKFQELVAVVMSLTYSAYVQHQQRLIDDEVWEAYVNAMFLRLEKPGFRMGWRDIETGYPKSFRDIINNRLAVGAAAANPKA